MHVLFCASADLKDAKYIREGSKNLLQMKFGTGDTIAVCGKVVECKRTKFGVMLTLNDGENFVVTAGTFNKKALEDATNVLQKFSENKEIYLLIYANPFYKGAIYLNANQDHSVIEVTKKIYENFHELRRKGQAHLMEKFKIKPEKTADKIEKEEAKEEMAEILKKEEAPPPKTGKEMGEDGAKVKEERANIKENIYEYGGAFENAESADEYKRQREMDIAIVKFVENLARAKKDKMIEIDDIISELPTHFPSLKDLDVTGKIYELMEAGYFYEPKPGYIKVIT